MRIVQKFPRIREKKLFSIDFFSVHVKSEIV